MDLLQILILLVIAGICAAFAELLIGFTPGGLLISVIVGVIGAYLGNWIASIISRTGVSLFDILSIQIGNVRFKVFWAFLGSLMLLWLLNILRKNDPRVLVRRA